MEGGWDGQAVPLLNATTLGAVYLDRTKQSHSRRRGGPTRRLISVGIRVMYGSPRTTWILLAKKEDL